MTIRLRGTGRAFTDRVKGLWGDAVNDVFPGTWMPASQQTSGTAGILSSPTAPTATANAGAMNLADVALHPSLAAHSHSVPAGLRKNRKSEATRQAARVAAWEDEGGATALVK
jgi:hypothetical protein